MTSTKFIIENVRCFKGKHEFDIKPLIFITGGNSSGKSTVLACWQVLANFFARGRLDFNHPPYAMGSFDDIVSHGCKAFAIGLERRLGSEGATHSYMLHLQKQQGSSEPKATKETHTLSYNGQSESVVGTFKEGEDSLFMFPFGLRSKVYMLLSEEELQEKHKEFIKLADEIYKNIYPQPSNKNDSESFQSWLPRQLSHEVIVLLNSDSIAPIRVAPRRTYDPIKGVDPSQGDDIPTLLRNLSHNNPERWKQIQKQLNKFGKESGMFSDISVKKFSESDSDPFQIQIKAVNSRKKTNLIDVGYGTSQILPIIVRILREDYRYTFLMQQPEVHLHPKAQATLTSFLIANLNSLNEQRVIRKFLVETHSDYMIDRARIEVMHKRLKPEDLAIIYLEPPKGEGVQVANLTVDQQGNLKGMPDGYRDFFLKETKKLLGF